MASKISKIANRNYVVRNPDLLAMCFCFCFSKPRTLFGTSALDKLHDTNERRLFRMIPYAELT